MFQQWRIVFERSNGAAFVHDAEGEDDDAVPEDGWRSCDVAGECRDDDTLRVTGELHFIYRTDKQIMDILVGKHSDTIKLSSTGPASEKYPESLGEYQLLQDISHNGFPLYQSLARGDRYIINIGEYFVSKYQF